MKAIISPWAYLPFHIAHSFPLTKWMGGGNLRKLIMLAFHLTLYLAEHWTSSFPRVSKFVYDTHLHDVAGVMILLFFYFSYHNCGENQALVRNWFVATIVFVGVNEAMDVGSPKPTIEEHIDASENDVAHDIAHFVGHCFLMAAAWNVASVVDVTNGLKMKKG